MMIHDITQKVGSHKRRKRIGRGIGSGHGKTSGRGTKGAGSRSGWSGSIRPAREGGQISFAMRLPKRGFSNFLFRTEYVVINCRVLEANFKDGDTVNAETLDQAGLVPHSKLPLKVLGEGELTRKLNVTAAAFSKTAQEKIEKAGGTITVVPVKKPGNPKVKA